MWIQGCHLEIKQNQIKQLGISFASIFLLFSNKSSRGASLIVAGGNPRPPALYDSPVNIQLFRERLSERMHAIAKDIVGGNFECCTVPQMIPDRKWSPKWTANDPRPQVIPKVDRKWSYGTDYKKETFFSRLLKKKGKRTLHLTSIFVAEKFKTGRTLRRKNSIILTSRSSTCLLRNTKPGTLYITRALLTLLIFLEVSN